MYRTCARYSTRTTLTLVLTSTKTFLLTRSTYLLPVLTIGGASTRSSKHTLRVRDLLLFCMCMLRVFYCARSFSSLGGRGRSKVGALKIAYLGIAYFGIAYFGICLL
jgi:hypothetical protein